MSNSFTSIACVYAFERVSAAGERLLCVLNLSDNDVAGRSVFVPGAKGATVLLNTDWGRFGGATPDADGTTFTCANGALVLDLPAFSGMLLRVEAHQGLSFSM